MPYQTASSQDVVKIEWPGPLVFPAPKSYRVNPAELLSRICWVFIGSNMDTYDSNLTGFMNGFRRGVFDGLILTVSGSLPPTWLEIIRQWTCHQGFRYFEFRSWDPTRDFEASTRQYSNLISSFLSIPFDRMASLTVTNCARKLDNLEVVHIHSPRRSLNVATINAAQNGLGVVLGRAEVRRCVLPLDLIEYLDGALDALARGIGLEELELTSPDTVMQDHDISPVLAPGIVSGGYALYNTVPPPRFLAYLGQFTSLKTLTIPISIVTREFLWTIASLSTLRKLKATPIRTIISLRHFLISVQEANIREQGPGRFEFLDELDLDSDAQVFATATLGGWDWYEQLQNIFPGTRIT